MKGISHFLSGVALATFFPEVVAWAREGALLPALAGIAALLPDTLDFRFVQFWQRFDVEIDPAGYSLDGAAEAVVERLAAALRDAYETQQPRRVIAHTLRLGSDLWRRYTLRLEPEAGTVAVRMGPLVNTGQLAYPGTTLPDAEWAVRHLEIPLRHSYSREYNVDIFSGPTFLLVPEGDGLRIEFLDWHHRWTHSLLLALALGVCAGALCGAVWGQSMGLWSGLMTWLGFTVHVLEDQLGHMGSSLWWPLSRARVPGVGALHANDAAPNFLAVWTSLAVILLNLDRLGGPGRLPVLPYLAGVLGLPWGVFLVARLWRRVRRREAPQAVRLPEARTNAAASEVPVHGEDAVQAGGKRRDTLAEVERLAEAAGPGFS